MKMTKVVIGLILIVAVTVLPQFMPVPAIPMQFKVSSISLSTAGSVCRFSAAYVNVGTAVLAGVVSAASGGAAGLIYAGAAAGAYAAGQTATGYGWPANPNNCPP